MKSILYSMLVVVGLSWTGTVWAAESAIESPAPGLRHLVISKGEVATAASFRLLIGVFDSQSEADQMLARLGADGYSAALDADGKRYRIVIPGLSQSSEAEDLRRRLLEQGYPPPLEIQEILHGLTHPEGPWKINVLEVDPKKIQIRVAHAYDAAIGLETTADLAERHGALAAVNGGFFLMTGLLAGDSQGTLRIDGRLLSEPDRGRATVGFYTSEGVTRAVVGRLSFRGEVRFGDGTTLPLDGINRSRNPSEIILFTPEFHRTTLTSPGGVEIIA
ncbi:MAG: SPOR domain-containing protein, partial [Thermoanaerobaculales bacterium]|nr:SPOR domain-containing protein [Thermoanaerobaculales bacterium]